MAILSDELIAALRRGEREVIAAALAEDAGLCLAADGGGMTLLHLTIAAEQPDIAADLLALPEIALDARQESHGRTPLHLAAIKGRVALLHLLLQAGANVFALDNGGQRPLDVATTPAAIAALRPPTLHPETALREAIRSGAIARLRRQMQAQPDLCSYMDGRGDSPLHWAAARGNVPVVQAVLEAGVPVTRTDRAGRTALYLAVAQGHLTLIETLLSAGAAANQADYQRLTPLHVAAGHGDATRPLSTPPLEVVHQDAPAPPRILPGQGAFDFASPTSPTPLPPRNAARAGDYLAAATALLRAGADANARARGGRTALQLAAALGDEEMCSLLTQGILSSEC